MNLLSAFLPSVANSLSSISSVADLVGKSQDVEQNWKLDVEEKHGKKWQTLRKSYDFRFVLTSSWSPALPQIWSGLEVPPWFITPWPQIFFRSAAPQIGNKRGNQKNWRAPHALKVLVTNYRTILKRIQWISKGQGHTKFKDFVLHLWINLQQKHIRTTQLKMRGTSQYGQRNSTEECKVCDEARGEWKCGNLFRQQLAHLPSTVITKHISI